MPQNQTRDDGGISFPGWFTKFIAAVNGIVLLVVMYASNRLNQIEVTSASGMKTLSSQLFDLTAEVRVLSVRIDHQEELRSDLKSLRLSHEDLRSELNELKVKQAEDDRDRG